ncbi:hypothetical protein JOC34_000618 [Virgibacillus halotolerans]|uniref:RNA ligase family protein n=1 Tax=Virgibacillus halotolerans TaxID=1071053 RepID=UPI001EF78897|nr:RNA ligase family protein [Virgibacillus halotolerans]MBM7598261.1 hypothetical protein [Virgibacillus halotolerans]
MKKYSKIVRHGKSSTHLTIEGNPEIVVMEKFDGANASFKLEDGTVKSFSRNKELDENDNLRGFREWVQDNVETNRILSEYIYYGEWLVRHKLDYGDNERQFYLFDIYDERSEEYLPIHVIKAESKRLGLNLAPVFYEGEFQSLDHINSFVGESKLGDIGEGVVVKNYNYKDKFGDQVFTKIVSDQFAEKAQTKKQKLPQNTNELDDFVDTYLTKPRVEKMLHKLVDEGILDEEYDISDTGVILKNSGSRIIDDILEEESDSLIKIVKKKIGKKYPSVVKEVILETR